MRLEDASILCFFRLAMAPGKLGRLGNLGKKVI